MHTRTIGRFTVSAIGLGAMPLSMNGDNAIPAHDEAVATVHAALDAGITFIDTADIYAPSWDLIGHNERIVRDALATWSGDAAGILVGTKGGITRTAEKDFGRDGSLAYLRSAAQRSAENLGVDRIAFYQYHRPDRWLGYGEVMESLATLHDDGLIDAIGISNASVEEIEIAREVLGEHALVAVQNQFSPRYTHSYDELRFCDAHGIAFLPWSPLGGTGGGARDVGARFAAFREVGETHAVSPQQVVLAWELSLSPVVVPIPGARRAASIVDSARAVDLVLSDDELAACDTAVGITR